MKERNYNSPNNYTEDKKNVDHTKQTDTDSLGKSLQPKTNSEVLMTYRSLIPSDLLFILPRKKKLHQLIKSVMITKFKWISI